MEDRYTRIADYSPCRRIPNEKIMIQTGAILWDSQKKVSLIQLKFRNASGEAVKSVYVKLRLYDHENHLISFGGKQEIEADYIDVNVCPFSSFGEKTPVVVDSELVRRIEAEVFRIVWKDGRVENVSGECVDCSGQDILEEEKLLYQEACGISEAKWKPRSLQKYWQCTCGYLTDREECPACGAKKENLFYYQSKEKLTEFQKGEENKRQREKERKRKQEQKDKVLFLCVLAGALLIGLLIRLS